MKSQELPIPLRCVVGLPRWLMLVGATLCAASIVAGIALAVYGFRHASGGELGGWIGGALGCILGGAGGLLGTLCDWRRRMPAPVVFGFLHDDSQARFYRMAFWPAVAMTALGLGLAVATGNWRLWQPLYQTGAIVAFIAGSVEACRRHTVRQARAVFALYADGLLPPEDVAAIDGARAKDPEFDRALADWQRISDGVDAMMR